MSEIAARRLAAGAVVVFLVVLVLLIKFLVSTIPCPQEPRLSVIYGVQLYFGACR